MCYVYMTEGVILAADTVHHIIPLKEAWDKRCDKQNLMPLHHDTHSKLSRCIKEKPVMEKACKNACGFLCTDGRGGLKSF
ncbi:MAG: HNH endonuclease [Ruminococcus sp.]